LKCFFPWGPGNAYEVEAAIKSGFQFGSFALNYAEEPNSKFQFRNPDFLKSFIHLEEFFEHEG